MRRGRFVGTVFESIQSATGNPLVDEAMILIAVYLILIIPVSLIAIWLLGHKRASFVIFTVTVVAIIAAQGLGQLYAHPPPHLQGYETLLENDPGNAFPSNHASAIFGFAFGVVYLRWHRLGIMALALAILLGFARVYTGLHFPLDIVGGIAAAVIGVGIVAFARPYVDRLGDLAISIESRLWSIVPLGR